MGENQEDSLINSIRRKIRKENISEPPKFKIVSKREYKYIADAKTGNIVSNGYDKFEVHRREGSEGQPTFVTLLGKKGSKFHALRLEEDSKGSQYFEESAEDFHDMEVREDLGDLILIKSGAKKYVVNPSSGTKATKGYHEFYEKDGKLYGQLGATTEEVDVGDLEPRAEYLLEE